MNENWLYNYDPETKQQWMEWRHCGLPRPDPKKFGVQNRLEMFSSRFCDIKRASSFINFQTAKLLTRVLLISAGANEGHFEGKTPQHIHQVCLVRARQCPVSLCTCNPEETGLPGLHVSWCPTLFSGSEPVGLPPVPWTEKTIDILPAEIITAAETWLDGQHSELFLSGLQKLVQQAKKCIELRGMYAEWIPIWSL